MSPLFTCTYNSNNHLLQKLNFGYLNHAWIRECDLRQYYEIPLKKSYNGSMSGKISTKVENDYSVLPNSSITQNRMRKPGEFYHHINIVTI